MTGDGFGDRIGRGSCALETRVLRTESVKDAMSRVALGSLVLELDLGKDTNEILHMQQCLKKLDLWLRLCYDVDFRAQFAQQCNDESFSSQLEGTSPEKAYFILVNRERSQRPQATNALEDFHQIRRQRQREEVIRDAKRVSGINCWGGPRTRSGRALPRH